MKFHLKKNLIGNWLLEPTSPVSVNSLAMHETICFPNKESIKLISAGSNPHAADDVFSK